MGLDVAYLKLEGMSTSTGVIAGAGVIPANTNTTTAWPCIPSFKNVGDQDNWMVRFRVHRDFYP